MAGPATPLEKTGQSKKICTEMPGTIEIFGEKKFKIWCHMLGITTHLASWAGGVGEAFTVLT